MSRIIANVIKVDSIDNLNIVNFEFNEQHLTMMSLDLNTDVKIGTKVRLSVKPSHVAIAKHIAGVDEIGLMFSYSNVLKAKIININNGKLLTSLVLALDDTVTLESIITFKSSQKMDLKIGDEVLALIKASELSIWEIMDA